MGVKYHVYVGLGVIVATLCLGCGEINTAPKGATEMPGKKNAGNSAIESLLDKYYADCDGMKFTKILMTPKPEFAHNNAVFSNYIQVADLGYSVLPEEIPAAEQRNGVEFIGRVIVDDAAVYRTHSEGKWDKWSPAGLVAGALAEQLRWEEISSSYRRTGKISQVNGEWDLSAAFFFRFDPEKDADRGSHLRSLAKPTCEELPAVRA